ncbi:MAG: DUF1800 domain-containing protein [Acidobacteriota bacterium]
MAQLTYDQAAHLSRRMGFGAPPEELDTLTRMTRQAAVDYYLNYESVNNDNLDNYLQKNFNPKRFTPMDDVQLWWIIRMGKTARPFEEKMTLFWHNHFVSALDKVPYETMYVQNQMLRAQALLRFDDILLNVARDPAMLVYLDGITNVLGNPNENFARELQELFTMGIYDAVTGEANYTEKDVKEIARAFTGWKFKEKGGKKYKYVSYIETDKHDAGPKEIYGRIANYTGEDVIAIISERRATARFLVKKLFNFFVYPLADTPEDKATIEKFANVYFTGNHSIRELARAIFNSDEFFSPRAEFALIKSPAELTVGAMRMLGADYVPGNLHQADYETYVGFKSMGFDLLNPFDVSGFPTNLGWLNTSTMLERYNFAARIISTREVNKMSPGIGLANEKLKTHIASTPEQTVRNFLAVMGALKVDNQVVAILTDYLTKDDEGGRMPFEVDDHFIDKNIRGLVFLIMCLPEFQLN